MKERYLQNKDFDGMNQMTEENLDVVEKWLDADLEKCLINEFTDLVWAVESIKNAQKKPNKKNIFKDFSDAVLDNWLAKVFFHATGKDEKLMFANMILPIAYSEIINNKASKYRKILEKAIGLVLD